MKCPVDGTLMLNKQVDVKFFADVHLDMCRECHGVWLDSGELERLMFHFGSDVQNTYKEWLQATSDGTTEPRDFWRESEKVCPKDGAVLNKHYTGMAHKVGVEQCVLCRGLWFDGSELYAIAKANEPNLRLDNALGGAARGLSEELSDNYKKDDVAFWDLYSNPIKIVPHIKNLLLDVMAVIIFSRK